MKVILLEDVKGTGKKGDLVEVSDGFSRNFLLPKKKAKEASAEALNELNNEKAAIKHRIDEEIKKANTQAEILNGKIIKLYAKAGKEGKLFGSVTAKEIAKEIENKYSIKLDKRKIALTSDIKVYGTYECAIKLYSGISAKVSIMVTDTE